jgi:signal transduction histidine kinase
MLLAFPSGRLETTVARTFAALAYLDVLLLGLVLVLVGGEATFVDGAPRNPFGLFEDPDAARVLDGVTRFVGASLLCVLIVLMARKRRAASEPMRRAMAPIFWPGIVLAGLLAVVLVEEMLGARDQQLLPSLVSLVVFATLPFAFMLGLLRSAYSKAGAVAELVERLNAGEGEDDLREALADALGDSSLELAYWSRSLERYVDAGGQSVTLPAPDSRTRGVTEVERDDVPIAAIIHDVALVDEPGLVRAAGAAAALALENERLEAELRARVEELRVSRAKVIEVGMAERRALERNLHDGAQQRLVALSLQLGLAKAKLRKDPDTAEEILEGAREELAAALEELRELARGIHPAILTDRGLGAALEVLAGRAPLPVELEAVPEDRLPAPVEAAAYFVVSESLANISKYAQARHASVRVSRDNDAVVIEVQDDGIGGADPAAGSGLRGLADRLAALDGRLEVHSPPTGGTLVRARVPCA